MIVFGIIGLLLIAVEVFVPGGILGTLGILALIVSATKVYTLHGWTYAVGAFIAWAILATILLFIEIRLLSRTRFGNRFFLKAFVPSEKRETLESETEAVTLTDLVPSGKIRLNDKECEATSRDGMIEKGTTVRVIGKKDFVWIVRRK